MNAPLITLLPVALLLAGCDEKGNPTSDVEVYTLGAVAIVFIVAVAAVLWKGLS